ncbi:DUF262 domain-containing protein [Massilia sp. G4R7]|uniref:DUF262 domain-containing protein n=1 Tax=Massilia phyllostachyos TaxID=2898585 RepID=A0ABS8Q6C4_9BURK|nr:DUF262 domain-containing protein [Massilia phyllostachyos]MCD2517302.1 DUF262 domain-containing protein [Massilia phyllostachyos]
MDFQQSKYSIDSLVQRVRSGKLALPDFQRDFVWEPKEVVDLLDSISRQWPIGSLLLLSGPQPFAFRPINSGPELSVSDLDLYILDGQQRVTALFHAIADVSDFCYFVDFQELLNGSDEVFSWERRSKFERQYPDVKSRAKGMVALVTDLWEISKFYEWMRFVPENIDTSQVIHLRQTRLGGLQSKVYDVFAIVLEQDIDLEALARIFETINRKGVDLDAFELLVAKLYPHGFNLKEEWEKAREEFRILGDFDPDEKHKLELLKLVSLIIRISEGKKFSRGVRQGDLLALSKENISTYWRDGVSLMAETLQFAKLNFGVISPELLPNWAMIHGLAGLIKFHRYDATEAWWRNSLIEQHYAQAANTKIVAHWDILRTGAFTVEKVQIGEDKAREILAKPAGANGLLNKGLLALIYKGGALDPLTNKPLQSSQRIAFRSISSDGVIRRIRSVDKISQIIMLSDEGDKKIGRQILASDPKVSQLALSSQGLDLGTYERVEAFLINVLQSGEI